MLNIFWIFPLMYEDTIFIFLFLRDLAVCMKTKHFIFIFLYIFFMKTRYFNTGFVSLQYKNTNQYWSKCSKIYEKITKKNLKIFFEFIIILFIFLFFGLGPAWPVWLGWTQQSYPGHWPNPVTWLPKACMRELFTHAVHSAKVIKITFAQCYITTTDKKKRRRTYLVRGGRAEDDDWMILLDWPAVALQAVLLAVADWRMAWTVAGLSSSSPLRFFFFCYVLLCFCFLLLFLTVLLPSVLCWLWRRRWWWLLTEEWLGLWSAFLLLLLCVFFSPALFSSVSVFFFCFSRCCCRVCCGGGCWSVELLWEATVALLLSVQRREPFFFSSSLPPSLSCFFLFLTFPLYYFSFPSGPSPPPSPFLLLPLLGPSSGFYSQRMRALWHAYGNGRVRHAPLKQLRYLYKNASLSLYF